MSRQIKSRNQKPRMRILRKEKTMNEIVSLTETEAMNRMVYLSATPDIPPPGDWQRRAAKPLRLSAAAPAASRPTTTACAGPKNLAEAIRLEQKAGAGDKAAEVASKKHPHLVREWLEELKSCRGQ
jgi:hypothetical protein